MPSGQFFLEFFVPDLWSPAVPAVSDQISSNLPQMPKKTKELTEAQRHSAFLLLLSKDDPDSEDGLRRGAITEVAKIFDVHRSTISRFWREWSVRAGQATMSEFVNNPTFFSSKVHQRGRKPKWDRKELREEVRAMKFKDRRTIRGLASKLNIPRSTIGRMIKVEGVFRRHSSAVKPILTDENKVARVLYCLEEVFPVRKEINGESLYLYKDLFDRVDVDEKWFYMTQESESFITVNPNYERTESEDDEERDEPVRRTRHKNYIQKVLFLCAQARPRWDPHRNAMWDGKIGIWPIGDWVQAQ